MAETFASWLWHLVTTYPGWMSSFALFVVVVMGISIIL